jgi:arylsulfatase A-like enzyme
MLWFCSDNGPERAVNGKGGRGTAGPLRARKRSLFEGGVRVPGLLLWPARIDQPRVIDVPACTSDYFPTILDALDIAVESEFDTIDGLSLMPLIEGDMTERPEPIAFQSRKQRSLTGNRYKLISQDDGKTYMLFDLIEDPGETTDIAPDRPEIAGSMRKQLEDWIESCQADQQRHKELREAPK